MLDETDGAGAPQGLSWSWELDFAALMDSLNEPGPHDPAGPGAAPSGAAPSGAGRSSAPASPAQAGPPGPRDAGPDDLENQGVPGELIPVGMLAGRVAERLVPGPDLAAWLSLVPAAELGDADLAATAGAWRRLAAWAQARELAAVAQIASRSAARDEDIGIGPDGRPARIPASAAAEVALELTMSRYGASWWAGLAVDLGWRLPGTGAALESGVIDLYRARLISEATTRLSDEAARSVESKVLPAAGGQTPGMLRAALRRAVIAADPEGADRRREESERQSKVVLYPDEEHTATLAGQRLPVIHAAAAMARIRAMARAWKASGACGGMDLLSAKVYLGLLLGTLPLIPPAEGAPPDIPPGDDPGDPDHDPGGPGDGPGHDPGGPGDDPGGPGQNPPGGSRGGVPGDGPPRGWRNGGPGSGRPPGGRPGGGPDCGGPPRGGPGGSPARDGPPGGDLGGSPACDDPPGGDPGGSPGRDDPPGGDPGGGPARDDPPGGDPGGGPDGNASAGSAPDGNAPGGDPLGSNVPGAGVPPPGDQDAPRDEEDYSWPGNGPARNHGPAGSQQDGPSQDDDDNCWQARGPAPPWPGLPAMPPPLAGSAEGGAGPVPGLLDVSLPWLVLAGARDGPGYLGRIGPIPASQARRLAACAAGDPAAEWRIIVTTPAGHAIAVTRIPRPRGPARPPPPGSRPAPGTGLAGRVTLTIPEDILAVAEDVLASPPPGTRDRKEPGPGPDPPGNDPPGHDPPGHDPPEPDPLGHDRPGPDPLGHDRPGPDPPEPILRLALHAQDPAGPILRLALHAAVRAAARARAATAADTAAGGCAHTTASPGYRPPPRLRDHVIARDLTCRSPVCRQPAWRGELDHTIPWDEGPTCACNLGGVCKADHLLKHHPDWRLRQTSPGTFTWTTPAGRNFTVTPDTHPL